MGRGGVPARGRVLVLARCARGGRASSLLQAARWGAFDGVCTMMVKMILTCCSELHMVM